MHYVVKSSHIKKLKIIKGQNGMPVERETEGARGAQLLCRERFGRHLPPAGLLH